MVARILVFRGLILVLHRETRETAQTARKLGDVNIEPLYFNKGSLRCVCLIARIPVLQSLINTSHAHMKHLQPLGICGIETS